MFTFLNEHSIKSSKFELKFIKKIPVNRLAVALVQENLGSDVLRSSTERVGTVPIF